MFLGKAMNLPFSGAHEKCLSWVSSLALLANTIISWKGSKRTNTLAHSKKLQVMTVKSFITLAPEVSDIKHFLCSFAHSFIKLHLFTTQENIGYSNTMVYLTMSSH
jgi:hypothetical protein